MQTQTSLLKDIKLHTSSLFKLNVSNESKHTLINQYIKQKILKHQKTEPLTIFTPNPEQVVQADNDPQFLASLQSADVLIPDGNGLVWASRLLQLFHKAEPIRERVAGVDMLLDLIQQFPDLKSVIIGGHDQGDLSQPRTVTVGERTVAWFPGYQQVTNPTELEEKKLRAYLQKTKPDMVFVAFGAPYQEYWVLQHKAFLAQQGVRLVMVVGGAVDVLVGRVSRAPAVVRSLGVEWLYRLIQQPWRWRRQLRLLSFIKMVIQSV